jgi:hypothetical protein
MSIHRMFTFGILLALAGCGSQPDAPIYGAWQGSQPGPDPLFHNSVDLVLRGTPGADSGAYRIATTGHDPSAREPLGTSRWGGTWQRSQRVVDGQSVPVLHLDDALPSDISSYALMPDGTLHALDPSGMHDSTRVGASYALAPVPAGPRRGRV